MAAVLTAAGFLSRRGALAGGTAWLAARSAFARDYDPLSPGPRSRALDQGGAFVVHDAARRREIPLRIDYPALRPRLPVILFSHGLGGSRHGSAYLAQHWVARGYAVVRLQHPGSDDAVWRDAAPGARMAAMRRAATVANLAARMLDVAAALDALATWQAAGDEQRLVGRLDLGRIGMSGHSFGALTTQAVAGQHVPPGFAGTWPDPRIRAALMMSPSAPALTPAGEAFGQVRIPWMLMTGTDDRAFIGGDTDRLAVFPALPQGRKYELVLDGAEHSAFGDAALPGDRRPRNPAHHRAILALGTAFWDSALRDDAMATAWLDGSEPRTVLVPGDRWQRK